jgi:hypothetical protein
MNAPPPDWPPIIRSAQRSRLILWRDGVLTALMWGLLFAILYSELAFALGALDVLLGRSEAEIDAEIALFFRRMRPLLWLIAALVLMLAVATIISRQRRSDALSAKQPTPLSQAEIAAIAGLDAQALTASQALKTAVVTRRGTSLAVAPGPAPAAPDSRS